MFRAYKKYRTNTHISGGGDGMSRKSFVKEFKNAVVLSRSK